MRVKPLPILAVAAAVVILSVVAYCLVPKAVQSGREGDSIAPYRAELAAWGYSEQKIEEMTAKLEHRVAIARERFPFDSLEARIPPKKAMRTAGPLPSDVAMRLSEVEREIERQYSRRANLLKLLHDKTTDAFVMSRGFGAMRDLPIPDELLHFDYEYRPIPQPGYPAAFPISAGDIASNVEPQAEHYSLHSAAVVNFLYPVGFGYSKDRQHVAGFKPHGFRNLKNRGQDAWKVENILLVGILSNDQPTVYLTDHLPSMEQIKRGQTRWPDVFEDSALKALKVGEDLCLIRKDDTIRMVGALRATSQCLKCHEAQRGDLLGAFSYTLRQVKADDAP